MYSQRSELRCSPDPMDFFDDEVKKMSERITKEVLIPEAEKRGYSFPSGGRRLLKNYIPHSHLFGNDTWEENGFLILMSATKYKDEKSVDNALGNGGRVDLAFTMNKGGYSYSPRLEASISVSDGTYFYPSKKSEELDEVYGVFADIANKKLIKEKNFADKWMNELDKFPFPNSKKV